jgi:hypothetical protein
MKLEKIVTLANRAVRLRFLAMERSLRATGCELPLLVIPYDQDRFELPLGSSWWENPPLFSWLAQNRAMKMMRKYLAITENNYQFVDSDVIFLRNPESVLSAHTGFVTSCGHWRTPEHAYTSASRAYISKKTTNWQRLTFNAGQFACDRSLYCIDSLKSALSEPHWADTCLSPKYTDQPGFNLLVWRSDVPITNLTLPPTSMESTWAGDYPGEYEQYWADPNRKPYLIHWAGIKMHEPRPINDLFFEHLSPEEFNTWNDSVQQSTRLRRSEARSFRQSLRRIKRLYLNLKQSFRTA